MNYHLCFFLFFSFNCFAGIQLSGTRVIYLEKNKEANVTIKNPDQSPYLIQSWLESSDNKNEGADLPLMVTPPLFKLNGEQTNAIRIVKIDNIRNDEETVYWLNVKAIPTSDPNSLNELHISINTRIKVFYRPENLNSLDASVAYKKLSISLNKDVININNPTPYAVSFGSFILNGTEISDVGMILPNNQIQIKVRDIKRINDNIIELSAIDDFGAKTKLTTYKF